MYYHPGNRNPDIGIRMNTDNSQVIDAFNRLSREIKKALPYWNQKSKEWDALCDEEKRLNLIYSMMEDDAETQEAIKNLIESIINEHES